MSFDYPDKFVHTKKDMPTVPHWAIIEFSSILIPGDARSRECPGHGYPEHSKEMISYEAYLSEQKWKDQIAHREENRYGRSYIAVKVIPAKIHVNVSVEE